MPLKLAAPIEQDFILEESDKKFGNKGTPTIITVRQASQGQHERRDKLYSTFNRVFSGDTFTVSQNFSSIELYRLEVELTLIACNIEDLDGNMLFKFKNKEVTHESFVNGWNALPPEIAKEMHDKVIEVNPLWGTPLPESE